MEKKKGKCFSKVNMGQRKKSDLYETPFSMTQQFINVHRICDIDKKERVLEPAFGNGAITRVLRENHILYDAYDLKDGVDFLKEKNKYNYMITNPPFSLANKFIEKAIEIIKIQFCLLLPLSYLHGQYRYNNELFKNLDSVYVFTRMSMLGEPLREDGKYNTGMQVYAWFVWNMCSPCTPEIRWIDNSEYILKKGDK